MLLAALEPEDLVDENNGDALGDYLAIDDQDLVHGAVNAVRSFRASILQGQRVFVDPAQSFLEVRHDLLRPHYEDDSPGAASIWSELTAAHRGRQQGPGLGDRVNAPQHYVGRRGQAANLVGLGFAVQAPNPWSKSVVAGGPLDLIDDPGDLERLRRATVNLRSIGDETQDDLSRFRRVRRPEHPDAVGLEGGRGPCDSRVVRDGPEPPLDGLFDVELDFGRHGYPFSGAVVAPILAFANTLPNIRAHANTS